MKASDVREAAQIVESLARIREAHLEQQAEHSNGATITLVKPGANGYPPQSVAAILSRAAVEAALKVRAAELNAREAQLRRRAAQIGLVLP